MALFESNPSHFLTTFDQTVFMTPSVQFFDNVHSQNILFIISISYAVL